MTVTERIMKLVNSCGLTITEISNKTGIDKASFTRWKNRDYKPSIEAIVALSQFFQVSTDWLLSGEGEPSCATVLNPQPSSDLTEAETILLEKYRSADKIKRLDILRFALSNADGTDEAVLWKKKPTEPVIPENEIKEES